MQESTSSHTGVRYQGTFGELFPLARLPQLATSVWRLSKNSTTTVGRCSTPPTLLHGSMPLLMQAACSDAFARAGHIYKKHYLHITAVNGSLPCIQCNTAQHMHGNCSHMASTKGHKTTCCVCVLGPSPQSSASCHAAQHCWAQPSPSPAHALLAATLRRLLMRLTSGDCMTALTQ